MGIKIAIIDYGVGNLHSVKNAFDYIGVETVITNDKKVLECADGLLLPGVGAFADASDLLKETGLDVVLKKLCLIDKKPLLGICLGMQLLLDESLEGRGAKGLGFIKGRCERIKDTGLKIPHVGWNDIVIDKKESPIVKNTKDGSYVYFVHSYKAVVDSENLIAHTFYGETIPAIIQNDNIFGAQFHPEKSEKVGLELLKTFSEYVERQKK